MNQQQQEVWKLKVDLFRKRFGAREDVFGVKNTYFKTETDADTGDKRRVETSLFSPQCENFGNQSLCQISRNIGNCSGCPNKKYQRLTDEWIWKHISGQKDLILYLVQRDGIKFGACDFDYGSHFEDAKQVRDYSVKLGLPCYIARSSKKGYHLYWFFSQPVQAHYFTSLVDHIYDQIGFKARYLENQSVPLPEVFPKQTTFEESKLGNGIKIPMIEPKFSEGFNCWVDDDAVPLAADKQWDYFSGCREITPEQLTKVITESGVELSEAPVSRGVSPRAAKDGSKASAPSKPRGDFWKIVGSCPALKAFWDKDENGEYKVPSDAKGDHNHRTASIAFAISTVNGLEAVRDRWKGSKIEVEIQYAIDSEQHPWSCGSMQNQGICKIGVHPRRKDHCLEKLAPVEIQNGIWVDNPNQLPESEWAVPSPSRFASGYMSIEQILEELTRLFSYKRGADDKEIPNAVPPGNLNEQLNAIVKSSVKLSLDEQKTVRDTIKANKYLPAKELDSITRRVQKEEDSEKHQEKCVETPNFPFGGNTFFLQGDRYVMSYIDVKGMRHETELTNFTVDVKEEIITLSSVDESDTKQEQTVEHRECKGVINCGSKHRSFRIPASDWVRSSESFFSLLVNKAGGDLLYNKSNYDHIRNCINHFSKGEKVERKRVKDFGHYKIRGEHTFITPSVVVTKDEIRPNVNEFDLEFNNDATRPLDFKIIDDEQFKDLALHIINDYFNCNTQVATMTTFAHAMAAAIMSHLPLTKGPVLWLSGSFSSGKSFVAEMAQCFFGNFTSLTGMNSTGKGKLQVAHHFRNSLLVIDDFKAAMSEHNTREMIQFIHAAYDRSGRVVSNRNSTLKEDSTRIRGLIATTGEDFPTQEASAISRMLLVDVGACNKRIDHGEKVKLKRQDYCGFTPHFIQFVYNMEENEIGRIYKKYFDTFEIANKRHETTDSGHRISENLAFNMTAFRLAMEMLVMKGVIPVQMKEEFCAKHAKNLEVVRIFIVTSVSAQKGANLFLDELVSILQDPSKYHITNWHSFDPNEHRNSKPLGFYREKTNPDVVFVYPAAQGEVNMSVKKGGSYLQTKHHIARQLVEDGHIPKGMWDEKSASYCKHVTTPTGARAYCWAIKLESLGLTRPGSASPKPATKKEEADNVYKLTGDSNG